MNIDKKNVHRQNKNIQDTKFCICEHALHSLQPFSPGSVTWLSSLPQVNSHEGVSRIARGEPCSKDTPVPINMTLLWIAGSSELDCLCLHGTLTWWWNKLSLITTVIHVELLSMPSCLCQCSSRQTSKLTDKRTDSFDLPILHNCHFLIHCYTF